MKKKSFIVLVILLIFLGIIAVCCLKMNKGGSTLKDISLTKEEYENTIWNGYKNEELYAGVVMDGELLTYEAGAETMYYSLNRGSDTAINPNVRLKDGGELKVSYFGDEFTQEKIREGYRGGYLILIAPDGGYREFHLVMTTLPIMTLEYSGPIEDGYVDMTMSLYDNRESVVNRYTESAGMVKYRGASTLFFPKKSLRLSLRKNEAGSEVNNNISLLGMREDDDWILYSDYNDQERVRNVFSQNLWWETCRNDNSRGVEAGLKYEYVELFVNGEYSGLYGLGFPLDEKQLNLSGDYTREALYKKTGWESERNLELNVYGSLPGYSVKTDNVNALTATGEFGKWTDSEGNTFTDLKEWALLYEYYYYLAAHRDDSEALLKVHNEENLIEVALFYNLIQGDDNVKGDLIKNLYYSIEDTEDGPRALLVPWDMDITWGNHWIENGYKNFTEQYFYEAKENFTLENGYLGQLLLNGDTDIEEKLIEKYRGLRADKWSEESLMAMLDACEADIYGSGAYIRDVNRWPESTSQDPELGLFSFKEYVKERLSAMDEYIKRLEEYKGESTAVRRLFSTYGTEDLMVVVIPGEDAGESFYEVTDALGIDREKLDASAFVRGIYNYDFDYCDSFNAETRYGTVSLEKLPEKEYWYEDEATLMAYDVEITDMRESEKPEAAVYILRRNIAFKLNLGGDYVPEVNLESFVEEPVLYEMARKFIEESK